MPATPMDPTSIRAQAEVRRPRAAAAAGRVARRRLTNASQAVVASLLIGLGTTACSLDRPVAPAGARPEGTPASSPKSAPASASRPAREKLPYFWPNPQTPEPQWPLASSDAAPDPGSSPAEYFAKLCRLESGTFIRRTVADVEGYYIVRPRLTYGVEYGGAKVDERLLGDAHALEDPHGWFDKQGELARAPVAEVSRPSERRYDFVEVPDVDIAALPEAKLYFPWKKPVPPYLRQTFPVVTGFRNGNTADPTIEVADIMIRRGGAGPYLRFERSEEPFVDIRRREAIRQWWKGAVDLSDYPTPWDYQAYPAIETRVGQLRSRYGLVWRGIERPRDREMGIAGSELLVVDLASNEILAVRRAFAMGHLQRASDGSSRVSWFDPRLCPPEQLEPLVSKVLLPRNRRPAGSAPSTR